MEPPRGLVQHASRSTRRHTVGEEACTRIANETLEQRRIRVVPAAQASALASAAEPTNRSRFWRRPEGPAEAVTDMRFSMDPCLARRALFCLRPKAALY
jgi:hypothetical protein